jgi:predicted ATP-dependent serine protease
MTKASTARKEREQSLPKTPTGILGLDEIIGGGLPRGRPTLVCGGAGCGKTLLAMEFLVRGAEQYNEPGAFMAFEETAEELKLRARQVGESLSSTTILTRPRAWRCIFGSSATRCAPPTTAGWAWRSRPATDRM